MYKRAKEGKAWWDGMMRYRAMIAECVGIVFSGKKWGFQIILYGHYTIFNIRGKNIM